MKFICLEGIEHNNRFYTTYNKDDKEPEKLADGTVAYRVLGYADTPKEARKIIYGPNCDEPVEKALLINNYLLSLPSFHMLNMSEDEVMKLSCVLALQPDNE